MFVTFKSQSAEINKKPASLLSQKKNANSTIAEKPILQDRITFQLGTQTVEQQMVEEIQALLEKAKAKPFATQKLLVAHQVLQKMKMHVQTNQQDSAIKEQKVKTLETLLKQNAELRKGLDRQQSSAQAEIYVRPVSQIEEKSMDLLFQDLAHPDLKRVQAAKQRLLSLGLKGEKLDKITANLKKAVEEAQQVKFAGKSLAELLKEARQEIVQNSSMKEIVDAGVNQQLETVQHNVQPILFSAGTTLAIGEEGGHNQCILTWEIGGTESGGMPDQVW